jgi:hypothetical protein
MPGIVSDAQRFVLLPSLNAAAGISCRVGGAACKLLTESRQTRRRESGSPAPPALDFFAQVHFDQQLRL